MIGVAVSVSPARAFRRCRLNGELVFVLVARTHLVAAIADLPEGTPYYEAKVEGLEAPGDRARRP